MHGIATALPGCKQGTNPTRLYANKRANCQQHTGHNSTCKTAPIGEFGPDSVMVYGYCTEFLLQLQRSKCDIEEFDVEPLKAFLSENGDSIVAFKTDSIVKVHVHTMTPEKILEYARKYGEFLSVKIENMSLQHSEGIKEEQDKIIGIIHSHYPEV